jgi:TfoX N-terminal domain
MAYDEDLATRIRDLTGPDSELTEKKMFGGLAFLIRGHMAISASGQGGVLVHVDPGRSTGLMATANATAAVMQGREMPGWLRVSPEDLASDGDLSGWVNIGHRARAVAAAEAAGEQEAEEVSGDFAACRSPQTAANHPRGVRSRPGRHQRQAAIACGKPPPCGDARRRPAGCRDGHLAPRRAGDRSVAASPAVGQLDIRICR